MSSASSSKRIAQNTMLLYLRLVVVMIINLYIVRIVLNALGSEDYGIYNVVAGVITMLGSVSSVLATATQRYYSHAIGENRKNRLQDIFSASINIYAILSIIIILLGETVGLWFINTQLVIPAERMVVANWVYQFSIFSFISTIIQIPYSAAVIAQEEIGVFTIVTTVECILKLLSALLLLIIPFDRLIIYGFTLFVIHLLTLIVYMIIGHSRYEECHYHKRTDKKLYKEMLSFSGWSFFGSVAGVGMQQVNTILVNIFFGPIVNTARAIALQLNSAFTVFSSSFILAVKPPMIKSYAQNSYTYLNTLFNISNKFIYYCLLVLCIPMMLEMDTVLNLWLKTTTEQTVLFSKLIIIYTLIMSLNNPITTIIQATGHMKGYHVPVEIFTLLCVPATYILFKLGYPAYTTFIAMIVSAFLAHIVRLICLKKYYKPFSVREYLISFVLPAAIITAIAYLLCNWVHNSVTDKIPRLTLVALSSIITIGSFVWLIGMTKIERSTFKRLIGNLLHGNR
ncbi:MAG: polysaccharide biosynthesis protein [Rikenellaceae bacterium]|jgi:O-antigen/teichoic acid export membrane protein|nr:polysaccharide biosynthesis protein [Rikenellaceae bacterium]